MLVYDWVPDDRDAIAAAKKKQEEERLAAEAAKPTPEQAAALNRFNDEWGYKDEQGRPLMVLDTETGQWKPR